MATSNDTTTITLTRNCITVIDTCDNDLAQYYWYANSNKRGVRYAHRAKSKTTKSVSLHRVIMGRILGRELSSNEFVDHIDGNSLNNRRSNLRLATNSENIRNSKRRSDNTSGYKGVTFRKDLGKWRARIIKDGKRITVGYANTPEDAFQLYQAAAEIEYGEYARWE